MKNKFLLSLLFIGIATQIYSQLSVNSVIGISDNGLANSTNFNIPVSSKLDLEFGLYYNSNDYDLEDQSLDIPIDVFTGQLGVVKTIKPLSSNLIKSAFLGGASVGVEVLNDGRSELSDGTLLKDESGLIYGIYVGIQSAVKIAPKWDLVARYNSFYHSNSITDHKFILGLGLGYNF